MPFLLGGTQEAARTSRRNFGDLLRVDRGPVELPARHTAHPQLWHKAKLPMRVRLS